MSQRRKQRASHTR